MATFLKPDKTYTLDTGLTVKEYFLTAHNPNKIVLPAKRTAPLIGVTLHNTGDIVEASGTTDPEQYTRATVNGNMGDVRVHYYVDDIEAWRNLPDDYTSWHAATGGQGQGNCNTISIECIMRNQTDAESVASMENAAKLIASIFKTYGWTVEKNLYTHNYWTNYLATGKCDADLSAQSLKKVSTTAANVVNGGLANKAGKYCPVYILPQWDKFKALVNKYLGTNSVPTSPTETAPAKSDEETIWDFLTAKGLNAFAVAGIMGNLYAESALKPTNLQNAYEGKLGYTDDSYTKAVDNGSYTNFAKDSAGYGLAQWTYWTRKQALLDYVKSVGKSIGDLTAQLEFLWTELQGYKTSMATLKSATSVKQASDVILTDFERPADQSDTVRAKRAAYGQGYYDKYAKATAAAPTTPTTSTFTPYLVKVTASVLNYRNGAGTNYKVNGTVKKGEVYTIVGEAKGAGATLWGKLKSGAGWLSLDYCAKV
jgi:N-acetylmuramoyl-L-alanine amidase CwlA